MTRTRTLTLAAALALGAVGAVLATSTAGDQAAEPRTLTGCLRNGSAPVVYILRGAALPAAQTPNDSAPLAEDFVLVAVPDGTDLNAVINHRIAVTGVVIDAKDPPTAPGEANAVEKALKKIRVQSVKDVAGNCS